MSQKYFTTLTNIGAALHANAQLLQTTVPWTHLVLGDGNGMEPVPSPAQTSVIREVDRLAISSIAADSDNPNWIVIEAVIPADRGGYVVRETALMGGAGGSQCIAVGNYPSATKPLLSEGAGSELVIRVVVEVAHTATVTLKIDPAVVIASRDWVEKLHATELKRGLVELASESEARELDDRQRVLTPHTLNAVLDATLAVCGMVVFDIPGVQTWQVPEILRSGKKKARVRGVGGGGGAARRSTASNVAVTGGSGAGGFDVLVDLTGVVTVAVTVGAAGTVGATADSVGTPGGSTSFGAYASAEGGLGGLINGNVPLGGNAYSSLPGALLIRGGSPSASVSSPSGSTFGGGGGSSILGLAGGISGSGVPASGYGAGAGGSVTSGSPLSTSGVVIIEW